MDIIKRTEFAQNYLRDNVALNLLSRCWRLVLADKDYFICSMQLDFNSPETYFVFRFDDKDILIRLGRGLLEGNTIKAEEIKIEWINSAENSTKNGMQDNKTHAEVNSHQKAINEVNSAEGTDVTGDIHSQIKKELDGDYVNKI